MTLKRLNLTTSSHLPEPDGLGPLSETFRLLDMAYAEEADVSLYGDNLRAWKDAVAQAGSSEVLLPAARFAAKAAVLLSSPLWLIATIFSAVIGVFSVYTGGWLSKLLLPVHWLLAAPLMKLAVTLCRAWVSLPAGRPLVILLAVPVLALTMVFGALVPTSSNVRSNKQMLCELWPLTERRLYWLARYGNEAAPVL